MKPHQDTTYFGETETDCPNCGGEGFLFDCLDGCCEDADIGCDDCTYRCDWCNQRPTLKPVEPSGAEVNPTPRHSQEK